ncbi:uncharacterized protein znf839 [Callorhinchus milii]|uniref:uncharacterized protein znf839 n=1 Tax=Callorhinchus milii TaxID=7868 RepID=UPI001C3F70F8|nr:uncharacterized protein znf839 [Callorhinchus milii]
MAAADYKLSGSSNNQEQVHHHHRQEIVLATTTAVATTASATDRPHVLSKQFAVHLPQVLPEYVRVAVEEAATFSLTEELEGVAADGAPGTIIYVQPDGTFVEGTGLTPEEQQQLAEQLAEQQGLVEVSQSRSRAVHMSESQPHARLVQHAGLTGPQPVITRVTEPQQQQQQQQAPDLSETNVRLSNNSPRPPDSQAPRKSSSAPPCAPLEARAAPEPHHPLVQAPVCPTAEPRVPPGGGDHPGPTVQRVQACSPARVLQQVNIASQASAVNRLSPPRIPTAGWQQQAVFKPPLTIIHNAAQQLQNAAHQAVLQQNLQQSTHAQHQLGPLRVLPSTQHQLETVQVHIRTVQPQKERKDRPMPPLAVVQPKTAASTQLGNQSNIVSGGVNISGPQIIRIQPLSGSGPQQYILHSSSVPPIQLLVQRQPPPLAPVNSINVLPGVSISAQSGIFTNSIAASKSAVTAVVANSCTNAKKHELSEKSKQKKPVKIKTRSGRISRPPKYKVKDYKFIKTEDLAEGHQSDSDDYSEYSLEEEEAKAKEEDRNLSLPCSFKPKKFKCETCEKSYIGRGGLARHYRLNASHGQLVSAPEEQRTSVNKPNGNVLVGDSGNGGDENGKLTPGRVVPSPELMTPPLIHATESVTVDSTTASSQGVQQPVKITSAHNFPGHRQTVRRGRPPKQHNNTPQDQVLKRKARLKEFLKQCDDEELMELALPRLTKVITLWEFLLMKVERGRPARPHFPDVYKEFEMLHKHVKKMAEEQLSSSFRVISPQQPLQISCLQVAESLGMTEFMSKEKQQNADLSLSYSIVTVGDKNNLNSSGEKHALEKDFGAFPPSSKRMRMDITVQTESNVNQNGVQKVEDNLQCLTTEAGQKPTDCPAVNTCDAPTTSPGTLAAEVVDKHNDELLSGNNMKNCTMGPGEEQSNSEDLGFQVAEVTLSSSQLPLLESENQGLNNSIQEQESDFLTMDTDVTAEEIVQEQLSSRNQIPDHLSDPDLTSPVQSDDEMTNQNTLLSNMIKNNRQETSSCVQELQHEISSQDPLCNQEQSEQINDSDIADQMQQLENALSHDVEPTEHICRTEVNSLQQQQQIEETFEADISDQVELDCQVTSEEINLLEVVDPNKIMHVDEQNADQINRVVSANILESTVTEDGTLQFQLPDGSQEFLAQGHEQIFIQTSEGLLLSHQGTAVVSHTSDGIVIVTNADGTTMHIRTPDGVPIETVEALLAMDSEGQSETLLVSQTQTEVEQ